MTKLLDADAVFINNRPAEQIFIGNKLVWSAGDSFSMDWQVTSNDLTVTLPLQPNGSYNFVANWGDGQFDQIQTPTATHTYSEPGTYTISLRGTIDGWSFNNSSEAKKLFTINSFGNVKFGNSGGYFYGCENLQIFATDTPNLSDTTTMLNAFRGCSSLTTTNSLKNWDMTSIEDTRFMFADANNFNEDISSWNTSNVQTMRFMFNNALNFNQNISVWNTNNVTDFGHMFDGASAFNQNLDAWNTSSANYMDYMFAGASTFNFSLNSWVTTNVISMESMFSEAAVFDGDITAWDTQNVTNMSYMFEFADAFNQNISSWNVETVTNMSYMFYEANNFNQPINTWSTFSLTDSSYMFYDADSFNQSLASWDVTSLQTADKMFAGIQLDTVNYDDILVGWSGQAVQPNVVFDAGLSKYSASSQDERDVLTNSPNNWVISDGGQA